MKVTSQCDACGKTFSLDELGEIASGDHAGEWACDVCKCDGHVDPEQGAEGDCVLDYGHDGLCEIE